jgi:hypothetical protein
MPQDDPVSKAVAGAKDALANATRFTQSVEGNPTSSFAPKKVPAPKIPQAKPDKPSYGLVDEARSAAEGIKAKRENVEQYARQ